MALRFARGLFRLWLVLTVLWISGVGYVTWQTLPSANDQAVVTESDTIAREWKKANPGETLELAPWEAAKIAHKAVLYRHLWHASVFALVPPIFVLALGWALVWALRGFGDEPKV